MDWLINNLAASLLALGFLLLAIEVGVLGFSTFVLFFVGIAAVFSAGLMFTGLIPQTALSALLSVAIISALDAALLWKPLKNLQNKVDRTKAKSDLIGHSFVLDQDVSPAAKVKYRYSGIDWQLVSNETLAAGTKVEVTDTEVGVFYIKSATGLNSN